jgi:protein-S-isoprenylcysteine O-methyltransferase Ste14
MKVGNIVGLVWAAWFVYWMVTAVRSKPAVRVELRHGVLPRLAVAAVVLLGVRYGVGLGLGTKPGSAALVWLGVALVFAGLVITVWARMYLGRNWGTPMARKQNPELVTGGPYAWVRHPIYSGLVLAVVGSALAVSPVLLAPAVVMGGYFAYAAREEERDLEQGFGAEYRNYKTRTKMLVPFIY